MTPPAPFVAPPPVTSAPNAPQLRALRWRMRVVLAFAPDAADPRLARQRATLTSLTGGPDTRDLTYGQVAGETVAGLGDTAQTLRQRFQASSDRFEVVLIGKDGGVKLRASAPIPASALVAAIDAMPMRREEMRR